MKRPTTLAEILRYRDEHFAALGYYPFAIALTPGEKRRLKDDMMWPATGKYRVSADVIEAVYGMAVATLPCPDCGVLRRDAS